MRRHQMSGPVGGTTGGDAGVEGMKAELGETRMTLLSLQRNYETMSRMMQMKQQELEQVWLLILLDNGACASACGQISVCSMTGRLPQAQPAAPILVPCVPESANPACVTGCIWCSSRHAMRTRQRVL